MSSVLQWPGAVEGVGLDAGVAAHYGQPMIEQRALADGAAVVDLSHVGLVRVTGPGRLSWLHILTSQDLADLSPLVSTEALLLDPQGRIEHALGVVDDGTATWLYTEPYAAPVVTEWLERMKFRAPVEIADVSDDWAVLGWVRRAGTELAQAGDDPQFTAFDDAPTPWNDPWPQVALGGVGYSVVAEENHPGWLRPWQLRAVPRAELAEVVRRLTDLPGVQLAGTWAAEALRMAAWRPRAGVDTDPRSIAHEFDWLRTAVHLSKGCYRGQETVAKVHNLGHPPRRLVYVHLDGSDHELPDAGSSVWVVGADRPAGMLMSAARHYEQGPVGLALLKRTTPVDAPLVVRPAGNSSDAGMSEGGIAAAAQVIVDPQR